MHLIVATNQEVGILLSHFSDEQTKAQRSQVTRLRPHSSDRVILVKPVQKREGQECQLL